ncbi:MAG TPA: sarcosine oxidase subunit beta family protein [Steroidobacter sp.]|jgi:sarcosine oxidase subunit beta
MKYSLATLVANAFTAHRNWPSAWRNAEPQESYDAVIVGGGGHGLATAYYLAAVHGMRRIAVLERSWIGGGNTGRNTAVIRSNYLYPQSARFYDFSLRLYEQLGTELDFNIMFSQRGVLTLAHSRHDLEQYARWTNAMHCNGVDAELLDIDDVRRLVPHLNSSDKMRFPVLGGLLQPRAGIARHDAVVWAYARAASRLGVDIVQDCGVSRILTCGDRVIGVETSRGRINTDRVALTAASRSGELAATAGVRLPIFSYALQAMVSEPVKPVLDTVVLSPATGVYVSQADKGELVIGGPLDRFASYAQRGAFATTQWIAAGLLDMFASFGQLKLMRQWAGTVDVVHDSSPIIGRTPVQGLFVSCGWGTGGFKAIPGGGFALAQTIATGVSHPFIAPFGLERFASGRLIDEAAAAGIAH